MSSPQEEKDIYIIPPNFIETGTIFGGTIKIRNAVEAGILILLIGFPIFHIPATLTTRIIIACLTVLPAALFALIGIDGESLSSFAASFFSYLKNRRIIGIAPQTNESSSANTKKEKKHRKKEKNLYVIDNVQIQREKKKSTSHPVGSLPRVPGQTITDIMQKRNKEE